MDLFIFVLVKHPEVKLLNHMVCVYKKLPMLFSKVTLSFCTPMSNIRLQIIPKAHQCLLLSIFFNFSYYNESIVASQCDFNLHFCNGQYPYLPYMVWQSTPIFLPEEPPWTEEPGRLQSMGSQTVGHD